MPKLTPHVLISGLAAASLATFALAQNEAPAEEGPKLIHVEPVRSADEAHAVLDAEKADMPKAGLTIGMDAPKLAIAKWYKGDSVQQFEEGRDYVVEFWATWCGPCRAAFPHVSEMQKKHAEDVQFIGVNIWDRNRDRKTREFTETIPEQIDRVGEFVKEQGDRMSYTVAIEDDGKMAKNWMEDAGQNGIPCAFIVDGHGKVAWIGHPMTIDEPLEQVLAGKWDYAKAAADLAKEQENGYWYMKLMSLLRSEDTAERGYKLAYALLRTPFADDPGTLNAIAWNVLTSERLPVHDRDLAIAYASVACEKSDWKEPSIIDTLARGYYDNGDKAKAIELETKAVKAAEGTDMADDLKETLKKYQEGAND